VKTSKAICATLFLLNIFIVQFILPLYLSLVVLARLLAVVVVVVVGRFIFIRKLRCLPQSYIFHLRRLQLTTTISAFDSTLEFCVCVYVSAVKKRLPKGERERERNL